MKLATYEDWKHCITELCDIPLTKDYITSRLAELNDTDHYNTQKFIKSWGEEHRQNVISWFKQAQREYGL